MVCSFKEAAELILNRWFFLHAGPAKTSRAAVNDALEEFAFATRH